VKPYASYRRLLANAQSALVAAVEIYNKPAIEYRDEAFAILVVNAWELLLKAVLAKGKKDIFYPKKRGEPYRTLCNGRGYLDTELPYAATSMPC